MFSYNTEGNTMQRYQSELNTYLLLFLTFTTSRLFIMLHNEAKDLFSYKVDGIFS